MPAHSKSSCCFRGANSLPLQTQTPQQRCKKDFVKSLFCHLEVNPKGLGRVKAGRKVCESGWETPLTSGPSNARAWLRAQDSAAGWRCTEDLHPALVTLCLQEELKNSPSPRPSEPSDSMEQTPADCRNKGSKTQLYICSFASRFPLQSPALSVGLALTPGTAVAIGPVAQAAAQPHCTKARPSIAACLSCQVLKSCR